MIATDFFAAASALPYGTLADITDGGGLVIVAPHPDDESLGCGGLIAAARAQGVPVRLVVISDGVGSHPNSRRFPESKLRALREKETYAAAFELGLAADAVRFLRLPDRFVPTDGETAESAREAILAAASQCGAGAICVTWHHDPHCDHVASANLVVSAILELRTARLFFYPVWGWTLAADTEVGYAPHGFRFDISRHLEAKAAAIAAHRSQTTDLIDDDPDGFRLTPAVLAHFARSYEVFISAEQPN